MIDMLARRWNALSLRTKMTGVSVLLLTIGLLVAGAGSASVLRNYFTSDVDSRISAQLTDLDIIQVFDITLDGGVPVCSTSPVPTDYFVALYRADGSLFCSNETPGKDHPALSDVQLPDRSGEIVPFSVPGSTKASEWRVASILVRGDAASVVPNELFTLVVGASLVEGDRFVTQFVAIFLFFAITVVVFGAALTRLLVTSTFAPLREVEATAARFAEGDFSQRMSGATPNTEVGRLNRSLNSMLARIDQLFADRAKTIEQMRRFVGDASHELRTPLVSVRGYAELYRMGALPNEEAVAQAMERIEKEAIRMGELVGDLLELARIDEAKPLQLADVDLVALARDAALDTMASSPDRMVSVIVGDATPDDADADAAPAADEPEPVGTGPSSAGPIGFAGATIARLRGRRNRAALPIEPPTLPMPVSTAPTTRVLVTAEENKIRQVVTNLMGNALRFTPEGSPIELVIGHDRSGGVATLSVVDHGEGIPEQIREKIFQRFWRADSSRTRDTGGSGLGLAIAASIVAAHKGTIDVTETPGGGATFRVNLPVLPETAASPEATAG